MICHIFSNNKTKYEEKNNNFSSLFFVFFSPEEIFVLDTMMICCVYININGDLIRISLIKYASKTSSTQSYRLGIIIMLLTHAILSLTQIIFMLKEDNQIWYFFGIFPH